MSLFPIRSEVPTRSPDPQVLDVDAEDADEVFAALSSRTSRRLYAAVSADPATASDLAETLDTSIQNVRYHVENLREADLVEVVDTWYSSRGSEMKVYGASGGPIVVFAGADEATKSTVREALGRFVGGVAVLLAASLLVQYAVGDGLAGIGRALGGGTAAGGDAAAPSASIASAEYARSAEAVAGLPPGLLFFAGGALVLAAGVVYLAWRGQRL